MIWLTSRGLQLPPMTGMVWDSLCELSNDVGGLSPTNNLFFSSLASVHVEQFITK